MNEFIIETAQRSKAKLRLGLAGPSGTGKTYSSLRLAHGIESDWNKIVIIDTEQGSSNFYAHLGSFKVLNLQAPYSPERYIAAIDACEKMGFTVIIIDSITHAWIGRGGLLQEHEILGVRDSYFKMTKPRHRRIIDRILASTSHVIVTVRSKQTMVISQDGDKSKVEKKGLDPITESNFDYEMSAYFELSQSHTAEATKDRTEIFMKPGQPVYPQILSEDTGKQLMVWANSGKADKPAVQTSDPTHIWDIAPAKSEPEDVPPPPDDFIESLEKPKESLINDFQQGKIDKLAEELGVTIQDMYTSINSHYGVGTIKHLTQSQAADAIQRLIDRKKAKKMKEEEAAQNESICSKHNVEWRTMTKGNKTWQAHKTEDGWCNKEGSQKTLPSEPLFN